MIVVLGEVIADDSSIAEVLQASLAHVDRSRAEPGCLSHDVARDAHDANRLLFTERWENQAALKDHFQVPESGEFAGFIRRSCRGKVTLNIYQTAPASGSRGE